MLVKFPDPAKRAARQPLRELRHVGAVFEDRLIGIRPGDGVGDNNAEGERPRAPVRREVDDTRRLAFCEQDISCEVAVDELRRRIHGPEKPGQPHDGFAKRRERFN